MRRSGILLKFEGFRFVVPGMAVQGCDCQVFGIVLFETRPPEVRLRTFRACGFVFGFICRAIAQLFEPPFDRLDGSIYRCQFFRQPVGLGIDNRAELFERTRDSFFGG